MISLKIKVIEVKSEFNIIGKIQFIPWVNPYRESVFDKVIGLKVYHLFEEESILEAKEYDACNGDQIVDLHNIKNIKINGEKAEKDVFSTICINVTNHQVDLEVDSVRKFEAGDVIQITF